jgi:menaquinone-dependent protoporphyrinogen IX oxidase
MSLTNTGETRLGGVPVCIDSDLPKEPVNPGRLSYRERYATVEQYLSPVLAAVPSVKPVSVGFFGGKLEYSRLKLFQMLFVMLIVQAQPGDRRNWPAIREWAAGLATSFRLPEQSI